MNNSKRVRNLFMSDHNIDIEFIQRHFEGSYWENTDKFIRSIWDIRLCMLSDKQTQWMNNILNTCIEKDPNKPYHKIFNGLSKYGTPTYKTVTKEQKEKHDAQITESQKINNEWYVKNVKHTEIDLETGQETIINDPINNK